MEIIIIALISFVASLLTFFSGFGLGTILTPVFALFFPIDLTIALTGVVHFLNNLFKITLVGKNADKMVLIRFGIPAVVASFAGAWLLFKLSGLPALYEYRLGTHLCVITPVKAIIALLLIIFVVFESIPSSKKMEFDKSKLPFGGILSGFFGGLSGLQGAIRSAFLVKIGLSKEAYIGTAVIIACFIDITRLSVYATRFTNAGLVHNLPLVIIATVAAISGAFLGKLLLPKITMDFVRKLVVSMLIIISLALGLGII
jgi:uncharacterized membrane protein YfcA